MTCGRKFGNTVVGVSILVIVGSIILLLFFPSMYRNGLEKESTLIENTNFYDLWKDLPFPVYQKFYFFNITNKDRFIEGFDEYLKYEEVGPYTYMSIWKKKNLTFENDTVSYREVKTYYFDQYRSNGTENDVIYSLSISYATATNMVRLKPGFLQRLIDTNFHFLGQQLIIKRTVSELTFKGYFDKILYTTQTFLKTPYHDSVFAWFYHRNDTDEGIFTVGTGKHDNSQVNKIKKWNGKTKLDYWASDTCNSLDGTNAEVGPLLTDNQTNYTFFQPLACRVLTFEYEGEQLIYHGLKAKRFQNTRRLFGNVKENPDNYCYVTDRNLPSGVLDISSCQFNAPVYLSFPHFYLADSSYLDNVNGLQPVEDLHKSYIDVNLETGVTVELAIRMQVNLRIHQNKYFSDLENVPSGIYPVFWVETGAEFGEELSYFIKRKIEDPLKIGYGVLGACLIAGLLSAIGGFVLLRNKNRMWQERQPLMDNKNNITYSTYVPRMDPVAGPSTGRLPLSIEVSHDNSQEEIITSTTSELYSKKIAFDSSGKVDSTKTESPRIPTRKLDSPAQIILDQKRGL
ncbi:scavenger receptor class B member 1 [Nephila pilipes]|uniref:Scavenger receptor class B member 1 n=1 Tax=Nephila pilipes TaxID=299642 RepID=A0A8X6IGX5_NEPPI|nr:scavenger receptor class B member 1 [Nephila pilipes]